MEKILFILAMLATVLFALQFLASLFGANMDFETDGIDTSSDFGEISNYFSLRNIVMFIMGFSWCAYLFYSKLYMPILFGASIISGVLFVMMNIFVYKMMFRMNEDNTHDINSVIGVEAVVTITTNNMGGKVTYTHVNKTYEALAYSDIELGVGSIVEIDSILNNKVKVKLKN